MAWSLGSRPWWIGQNYLYFLVAQDGTFLVKHRAGDATHVVKDKTASGRHRQARQHTAAPPMPSKSASEATRIDYVVNGKVVATTPKDGMTARTDGAYGIRVNHLLELHIDGIEVVK
jgi:hypothetical protein